MLDFAARWVKNGNTLASQVNVSGIVDGHSVGTEFAKKSLVRQGSVPPDLVAVSFLRIDVRNVQSFTIGSANNAIRPHKVRCYPHQLLVCRAKKIDTFARLFRRPSFPV